MAPEFETLLYGIGGRVATITLNRPQTLNTIVPPMPEEVEAAVELAVRDEEVKVIVVRGAGRPHHPVMRKRDRAPTACGTPATASALLTADAAAAEWWVRGAIAPLTHHSAFVRRRRRGRRSGWRGSWRRGPRRA